MKLKNYYYRMKNKKSIGVVHGRFQPLHLGHLNEYILKAKAKCDFLVIGLTNPDPTHTLPDVSNLARSRPQNNPLTYFERVTIIQTVLLEYGLKQDEFVIVPFPINFPQLLKFYTPKNSTHYLTVFDEWGEQKVKYLKRHGLKTSVLFRKSINDKKISSTMVRERLLSKNNWKELVPKSVHNFVDLYDLRQRLVKIRNQSI